MGGAAARAGFHPDGLAAAALVPRRAHVRLFDRTGNVGPTLWGDGRIVGGWAQDRDGQIVCRFLEDAGSDAAATADAAAQRLAGLLGQVRLTARTAA